MGPKLRDRLIQACHIGHAAAENDNVWVEHIDDPGERSSEPIFIVLQAKLCLWIAGSHRAEDFLCGNPMANERGMVTLQARTRDKSLRAA